MEQIEINTSIYKFKATIFMGRGLATGKIENLNKNPVFSPMELYPGTLNVVLKQPLYLDKEKADYCVLPNLFFWEINVCGIPCLAHRFNQCPLHVVEIVSKERLRDKLGSNDIELEIPKTTVKKIGFIRRLLWVMAWKWREPLFYTSNFYSLIIGKFLNLKHRILKILRLT